MAYLTRNIDADLLKWKESTTGAGSAESDTIPLAPIRITEPVHESVTPAKTAISTYLPSVTLAFPIGLSAHLGRS